MATLKQRLHRKNAAGTFDTVHLESSSDLILRPSGRTVEQDLADYLPQVQNNDNVPQTLGWVRGSTKAFVQQKELAYQSSVEDLKTSVSEGKALVAAAVTGKGVSTAADSTFQTIATNIGKIPSEPSVIDSGSYEFNKRATAYESLQYTFNLMTVPSNTEYCIVRIVSVPSAISSQIKTTSVTVHRDGTATISSYTYYKYDGEEVYDVINSALSFSSNKLQLVTDYVYGSSAYYTYVKGNYTIIAYG